MSLRSVASDALRGPPRNDHWSSSRPKSSTAAEVSSRPGAATRGDGGVLGDSLRRWMDHTGVEAAKRDRDRESSSEFRRRAGHGARLERRLSGVGGVPRTLADPPPPPPPRAGEPGRNVRYGDPETPARGGGVPRDGLGASLASRGDALGADALRAPGEPPGRAPPASSSYA